MIRPGSFITTVGFMAAILFLYGCSKPPMVPENSRSLSPCGNLPNCVNSQSGRGLQSSKPVKANPEQWAMLKAWISMQKDWQIIIEDESYIQAVVSTPLMKFKDDIQLSIPRRIKFDPRAVFIKTWFERPRSKRESS